MIVTKQVEKVSVQSVNEKSTKAYVLHQALELSKIYNKKNSLKRVCMIQTSNSRPLYFNHPVETHRPVQLKRGHVSVTHANHVRADETYR